MALGVSLGSLLVSGAALVVSIRTYLRDRAKLRIRGTRAIYRPGGLSTATIPALSIEVVNVGRRPIVVSSFIGLQMAGEEGMHMPIASPDYYVNRPPDGKLEEAKGFSVRYPRDQWLKIRAEHGHRCIGIHVIDHTGKVYIQKLSPQVAAWFNDEPFATRGAKVRQLASAWRKKVRGSEREVVE